ncbi:hypothetical protein [Corallibacter sp.]|uniref:hypothetical protein n=1 Tax=Corallibacter sp. TaxID=2038084 RepID=UPI003AB487BE
MDMKLLCNAAKSLALREGLPVEETEKKILASLDSRASKPLVTCSVCGARVSKKNLAKHQKKHEKPRKINWDNIPLIAEQKAEKRRIKAAAGKQRVSIVSGGGPGLGKGKS